MLMLKCKNCGEVSPGIYVPEDTKRESESDANTTTSHIGSRGHKNVYSFHDYMDWSGPETF